MAGLDESPEIPIILFGFAYTIQVILRQKKLSDIKSDFINNMTHELKTPLATISLAVDALRNAKVLADPTKLNYFSGIIKEENKRMNKQVETILQAALLDKQEVELHLRPMHAHAVISDIMDNFRLQLDQRGGGATLSLNAPNDAINADEVHFTNLLSNLVDNAIKYSRKRNPARVEVGWDESRRAYFVRDNGVGFDMAYSTKLFGAFQRLHGQAEFPGVGVGLASYVAVSDPPASGTS